MAHCIMELWLVLLLPWVLDVLGGRGVFTTLFGALSWGLAAALALSRQRTKEVQLRRKLALALGLFLLIWFSLWLLSFHDQQRFTFLELGDSSRWFVWMHAGLLASGAAMVFVFTLSSVLWVVQDLFLRKSSFERRRFRWRLPALESLVQIATGSVNLAFFCWGLGLLSAFASGIFRWKGAPSGDQHLSMSWWLDPRVLTAVALWFVLVAAFQLNMSISKSNRWLHSVHVLMGTAFLAVFAGYLILSGPSGRHEALPWFP